MEEARFTMRVHPVIMQKMKFIAKQNGRSINREIEQILKWVITDYENKYGRIKVEEAVRKPVAEDPTALDLSELYK